MLGRFRLDFRLFLYAVVAVCNGCDGDGFGGGRGNVALAGGVVEA